MVAKFSRRVVLVEDEQFTRALVANLLQINGFEVRHCGSALEASKLVESFDPDAMIVDISLGRGPTGIDLIEAIRHSKPHLAFVVLSNFAVPPKSIQDFSEIAYVNKTEVSDPNVLITALNTVLHDTKPSELFPFSSPKEISNLTRQQLEVLYWLSAGESNQEIARRRDIGVESVEQMLTRIYKKLGIKRDPAKSMRVQATSVYRSVLGDTTIE